MFLTIGRCKTGIFGHQSGSGEGGCVLGLITELNERDLANDNPEEAEDYTASTDSNMSSCSEEEEEGHDGMGNGLIRIYSVFCLLCGYLHLCYFIFTKYSSYLRDCALNNCRRSSFPGNSCWVWFGLVTCDLLYDLFVR